MSEQINDVLRRSLIGEMNSETVQKIIPSEERDRSKINDIDIIEDIDEDGEIIQIDEIENIGQEKETEKMNLEQKKENLTLQVKQLKQQIEQIQFEIKQLKAQAENNQAQQVQQNKLQALESEYSQLLKKFEELSQSQSNAEIKAIYQEYYEKLSQFNRTQQEKQMNDKKEEQLLKEIEELKKEYLEISDILENQLSEKSLEDLQQLLLLNEETLLTTMSNSLIEKEKKLVDSQHQHDNLLIKHEQSNNRLDNIFIRYNEQRKVIKQMQKDNSSLKTNIYLKKQKVSTSIAIRRGWKKFKKIGNVATFGFGLIILVFYFKDWFNQSLSMQKYD